MSGRLTPFSYDVGCIRELDGRWYLCNRRTDGWASFAFEYPTLDALESAWNVTRGVESTDQHGRYWPTVRP